MRLRDRFLLVGLGVVLFLIVTPFIVLYARGFKIDWENRTLVKTGALVVRTEPNGAKIFLNDELHESTTPANIRFMLPGDYNVRIEKEGYQSWTKRLSVRSQLVTWANSNREYLALFLANPILEKTSTEIPLPEIPVDRTLEITTLLTQLNITVPEFTISEIIRAENQVYLILDENLYLVNDKLEKIYSPVKTTVWYGDSKQLLYANDNEIYIYHTDWKTSDLILRSLTPIQNPVLNEETGYVFFQNEGKIKAIEVDDRDHRNIFTITDGMDKFLISEDGKKLSTFSQTEIKQYEIR